MSFIDNGVRGPTTTQTLDITSTTESTSNTTGALIVSGGVGVAKTLNANVLQAGPTAAAKTELGSNGTISYVDLKTTNADYDVRLSQTGGSAGSAGQGTLAITAATTNLNSIVNTTGTSSLAASTDGRYVKAETSADLAKISFGSKDASGGAVCASLVSSNSGAANTVVLNAAAGAGSITNNCATYNSSAATNFLTGTADATSLSSNAALNVSGGMTLAKRMCLPKVRVFDGGSFYTESGGGYLQTDVTDPTMFTVTCTTANYGGFFVEVTVGGQWQLNSFACSRFLMNSPPMTPAGFVGSTTVTTDFKYINSPGAGDFEIEYMTGSYTSYTASYKVHFKNGLPNNGYFSYHVKMTTFPDSVFTIAYNSL